MRTPVVRSATGLATRCALAAVAVLVATAPVGVVPGEAAADARVRSGTSDSAVAPRWSWPVTPVRVIQPYVAPPSPYAAGHRGIDLAAAPGATVTAPADATVRFAGTVVDRPVLTLDHGAGVLSSYEPLAAAGLQVGDRVARGAVLGVVAEGAHCSGVCLHVGVRIDGDYVSPLLFFDHVPRSVLLPLHPRGTADDHARG